MCIRGAQDPIHVEATQLPRVQECHLTTEYLHTPTGQYVLDVAPGGRQCTETQPDIRSKGSAEARHLVHNLNLLACDLHRWLSQGFVGQVHRPGRDQPESALG